MEREREVIQSLSPAQQHRMTELVFQGWKFQITPGIYNRIGLKWRAFKENYHSVYGEDLAQILDEERATDEGLAWRSDEPTTMSRETHLRLQEEAAKGRARTLTSQMLRKG